MRSEGRARQEEGDLLRVWPRVSLGGEGRGRGEKEGRWIYFGYLPIYPGYLPIYPGYFPIYPGYFPIYPGYFPIYPGYFPIFPGYFSIFPGYLPVYPYFPIYPGYFPIGEDPFKAVGGRVAAPKDLFVRQIHRYMRNKDRISGVSEGINLKP